MQPMTMLSKAHQLGQQVWIEPIVLYYNTRCFSCYRSGTVLSFCAQAFKWEYTKDGPIFSQPVMETKARGRNLEKTCPNMSVWNLVMY